MQIVRAGATPVEIENSGDAVFLYDAGSVERLRATDPAWALGPAAVPTEPAAFREGDLVVYEPAGATGVHAQVLVGEDLTDAELAGAVWLRPQAARLRLPTGKLRIETLDSLQLTAEAPTDAGLVLDVPAGTYRVALHRLDRAAMGDAGGWPGAWPDEVIVLTPGEAEAAMGTLRYPVARARWGDWTVQDGVATGEVTWALVGAGTNLDAGAVARLGLKPGMRLRATLGPQTHEAVFLGSLDQQAYRELIGPGDLEAAAAREGDLARAYMYPNPGPDGEILPALAFNDFTGPERPWRELAIGMPVEVRVLPEPVFAAPDEGWAQMWQAGDGVLRTEVVGCGASDLVLGATTEALAAIGAAPGERLTLEVDGRTRPVWLAADERAAAALRAGLPPAEAAESLLAWPMAHWELGDRRVLRLRAAFGPADACTGVGARVGATALLRRR